jgi:hypothetical protein
MRGDVILILCYPETPVKLDMVRDLIAQVDNKYPICLTSHMPLPEDIVSTVEYFIYDKNDTLSENYTVYYHYTTGNFRLRTRRSEPYHALAGYISQKSAATFLRNKFERLHYIQYDTVMRIPEYISMANDWLKKYDFVGAEYKVPAQKLQYIVGTFFSTNIRWYDNHLPEISSWDEYKAQSTGNDDMLLAENWLHDLFISRGMIGSCKFLLPEEVSKYMVKDKIQTRGGKEDGLIVRISELEDHRLIVFCHLYNKGSLDFIISYNGIKENIVLDSGILYWKIIDKWGVLTIDSNEQHFMFDIDPKKEYTETRFELSDSSLKCLKNIDEG